MTSNAPSRFLLTGATGFLGSHIMAELLSQNKHVVIAGRSSKKEALEQRIKKLLKWFEIDTHQEKLKLYETDFLSPKLGLNSNQYNTLCNQQMSIIHCASDTSFAEKNRTRVMKSNIESLHEILDFAVTSKAKHFYFISTAYASGIDSEECQEASVTSKHFNNVYEESKAKAESIISRRCEEAEIPYSIIRPSITYGDSKTGRSLKFNAMYYPINFLRHIRNIYLNDIKNNNGIKSMECGVHLNDNILHLPIKIFLPNAGKINFIPIDYFIDTFMSIVNAPTKGKFYHITNNYPKTMVQMIEYTQKFLNISGVEVIVGSQPNILRNPAEELFDHFIKTYIPYISDSRIFIRNNTDKITNGTSAPDISYPIFNRCMTFAEQTNWGKSLF